MSVAEVTRDMVLPSAESLANLPSLLSVPVVPAGQSRRSTGVCLIIMLFNS